MSGRKMEGRSKSGRGDLKVAATAIATLLAVTVTSACVWRDDEQPVEWVERPEAIVIQQQLGEPGLDSPDVSLPHFTLYGDGRLIFFVIGNVNDEVPSVELFEYNIPADEMRELLEFIRDTGFMTFAYDQPIPESVNEAPTVYLYVNAKTEANAVSAYGLSFEAPDEKEWEQFRRIKEVDLRMLMITSGVTHESLASQYVPEQTRLVVGESPNLKAAELALEWPYPDIHLASVVATEAEFSERVVAGDLRPTATFPFFRLTTYEQAGRFFDVAFLPVLPYEENFPEFDAPQ